MCCFSFKKRTCPLPLETSILSFSETDTPHQVSAFRRGGRGRAQKPNCAKASEDTGSLNAEKPEVAKTLEGMLAGGSDLETGEMV